MLFSTVAEVFEKLESMSSRLDMTKALAALLEQATPEEASILVTLSLGQLNPPYIGTQFNIAQKNMIKVVATLLYESEETIADLAKKRGDLGLIVQDYSWASAQNRTVEQVYEQLHAVEKISGTGSQEEKAVHLLDLLRHLSPIGAKYVIRIILGKLRLGFSAMTIVDALSWMVAGDKSLRPIIEHAYHICADIGFIAKTLKQDGIEALEKMTIHIGVPIIPAAAERMPTARAIVEKMGPCVAQPKLDGFRLQIHVDKRGPEPKVHFFSRNLQDMSYMFPDITVSFAALDVQTMICEGEAIVYDPNTGTFLPFQETVKRKRKHGIEQAAQELPLRVYIFDLLYLNGVSLLKMTHKERRHELINLFKQVKDQRIAVIEERPITTPQELEEYFNANIAAGLEGLVVKKPNSVYQPGKRNFNWIKLKRQEEGQLEDTVDCVVLGYYAGKGKRSSFGIGAFLVGVYNDKRDRFETVAKIGTGLSDQEWRALKKRADEYAVDEQPHNVVCAKELRPDVWVAPEIVVVVRADEITLSPVHTAGKKGEHLGYALRFPRFMAYREDKSAQEATTVHEIERLYQDQFVTK